MSNKIVPPIYRAIIDDVITAIKPEFDEYGVGEDVLAELHHKWQSKVMASNVAEFEITAPQAAQHPYAHPMHMMAHHPHYSGHNPFTHPQHLQQSHQPQVKSEPMDNRYMLSPPGGLPAYALPSLPGPQINGMSRHPAPGSQPGIFSFPPGPVPAGTPHPVSRPYAAPSGQTSQAQSPTPQPPRIPQVDGPSSSSSSESPSPPPSYAPRSMHPSLPQLPDASQSTSVADDEAINSDLDDSDTDGEEENDEGGVGETDIVFCTYDKVARVKTKWKCILKDGIVHVNGKDYLFAKCTGEFEW